ncbi:hypothetical protein D9M69_724580 [compost metagenome]
MNTSAAAFTDSTTPATSHCAKVLPTSGRSTNTTSPSASCAWSVMPTVAMSPSTLIHSWSSVYLVVMVGSGEESWKGLTQPRKYLLGTKGMGATSIGTALPRTMALTRVPTAAFAGLT